MKIVTCFFGVFFAAPTSAEERLSFIFLRPDDDSEVDNNDGNNDGGDDVDGDNDDGDVSYRRLLTLSLDASLTRSCQTPAPRINRFASVQKNMLLSSDEKKKPSEF